MEEIYLEIAERLRSEVPELEHIDEDTGQLYPVQYDDRYEYPILFPCLLIDASTVDWKAENSADSQRGSAAVTIKLAFMCDEDSHFSSAEYGNDFRQLKERQSIDRKVVKALHGYHLNGGSSPMLRKQSRNYSQPGRVKVYETTFILNVSEYLLLRE